MTKPHGCRRPCRDFGFGGQARLHKGPARVARPGNALAFWLGCALVSVGAALHIPMYLMGRATGYVLAGMPMDAGMIWGMVLIPVGVVLTGYGLLPRRPAQPVRVLEQIAPPEDAPLSLAHWRVAGLLALALVIDIMKPATLGFVTPGMQQEYGVGPDEVAWLPFAALIGTVAGSFIWGALADVYGRRASILLSSVMFIGTSICGAMPDFWGNVLMCLLMGMAAGGMLPVAYALLAEIMPTRHRGWCLVLVGGIGAVGGYFAASASSALLQPEFGWRILWFLNLPTGLILIALSPLLPESARFLQQMGRIDEARAELARFGARLVAAPTEPAAPEVEERPHLPPVDRSFLGITTALTIAAVAWGLVNFGLLLWLPGALVAEGHSVALASSLIAQSTLVAAPVVAISAWIYSLWSTRGSLLVMLAAMTLGALGLLLRELGSAVLANPVLPVTMLMVGACGVISILLPYTAECYPLRFRGRATGWIAGCSKLGGLIAQGLTVAGAIPALGIAALAISVPSAASLALIALFGHETRGRDLRELERPAHASGTSRS